MNKSELIDQIAESSGISKADAKRALDAFIAAVTNSLKNGERVSLVGFGSFSVSERSARTGRNPQTGKAIDLPAKNVVRFRPGTEFATEVQGATRGGGPRTLKSKKTRGGGPKGK